MVSGEARRFIGEDAGRVSRVVVAGTLDGLVGSPAAVRGRVDIQRAFLAFRISYNSICSWAQFVRNSSMHAAWLNPRARARGQGVGEVRAGWRNEE